MEKEERNKKRSDNSNKKKKLEYTRKSMENEMMETIEGYENKNFDENEERAESIITVADDEFNLRKSLVVVVRVLHQAPFLRYCNYLLLVLNCLKCSQSLCHRGQLQARQEKVSTSKSSMYVIGSTT